MLGLGLQSVTGREERKELGLCRVPPSTSSKRRPEVRCRAYQTVRQGERSNMSMWWSLDESSGHRHSGELPWLAILCVYRHTSPLGK